MSEGGYPVRYTPRYFKADEFKCPDCGEVKVAVGLIMLLDVLRAVLGVPIRINSGYRCATRNKAVGGSDRSRHMLGCAADLALPQGLGFGTFKQKVEAVFARDLYECKAYPAKSFIHVAIPRSTADYWSGGDIYVADGTNSHIWATDGNG